MLSKSSETHTPMGAIIRPLMQLRARLDRVITLALREKFGFGISQFRVLYVLAHKTEMSQKAIADYWDVTEASVSRQINILRKRGLIPKRPQKGLTPAGEDILKKALEHVDRTLEIIFRDVGEPERQSIAHHLEKLSGHVNI